MAFASGDNDASREQGPDTDLCSIDDTWRKQRIIEILQAIAAYADRQTDVRLAEGQQMSGWEIMEGDDSELIDARTSSDRPYNALLRERVRLLVLVLEQPMVCTSTPQLIQSPSSATVNFDRELGNLENARRAHLGLGEGRWLQLKSLPG